MKLLRGKHRSAPKTLSALVISCVFFSTAFAASYLAVACKSPEAASPISQGRLTPANYVLPYPVGKSYYCSQGFQGDVSHHGTFEYSIDFNMPEGELITCARDGVVERVIQDYADDSPYGSENVVIVKHADGEYSRYVHLKHLGSEVKRGDNVLRGDPIGHCGKSGTYLFHLHFDVVNDPSIRNAQTVPFAFSNILGGRQPTTGRYCTAAPY